MKVNPILYGILATGLFLGIVFGFQAAGVWSISGKVDGAGKAVQPVAGDAESIKGWMTLDQVSETYGVPLPELLAAFSLPADTPGSTALKEMESDTFSVTGLRDWLAQRGATP